MHTTHRPFEDMTNDLDDLNGAGFNASDMAAIAAPRFASQQRQADEFKEPCGKCGGSGTYHGHSRYGMQCFACKGAGFKTFRTSTEHRAEARRKAAVRAAEKTAKGLQDFEAEHPKAYAWMLANAQSFEFARSMCEAVIKWGGLTEGQLAAVTRCIEREEARRAEKAAAAAPAPTKLAALFDVMLRHSKIYAGAVTLSRSRDAETVWIRHEAAEKAIGKIETGGLLAMWTRPGVDRAEVESLLLEFEGSPLQTAQRLGKATGRCCSCGRELTDPASIEAGIGPVCAEKF